MSLRSSMPALQRRGSRQRGFLGCGGERKAASRVAVKGLDVGGSVLAYGSNRRRGSRAGRAPRPRRWPEHAQPHTADANRVLRSLARARATSLRCCASKRRGRRVMHQHGSATYIVHAHGEIGIDDATDRHTREATIARIWSRPAPAKRSPETRQRGEQPARRSRRRRRRRQGDREAMRPQPDVALRRASAARVAPKARTSTVDARRMAGIRTLSGWINSATADWGHRFSLRSRGDCSPIVQ